MRMYKENIWHPVSLRNMVAFIGNSEYLWGCPEMPKCPFASFHLFPILFFLASSWATSCSLFRLLLVFAISLFSTFKNIYLSYPKKKKVYLWLSVTTFFVSQFNLISERSLYMHLAIPHAPIPATHTYCQLSTIDLETRKSYALLWIIILNIGGPSLQ